MGQNKYSAQRMIMYVAGAIPVIWIALLLAPAAKDGLIGIVRSFSDVMDHPFHIELCEDSLKTVLILLLAYGLAIGVWLSSDRNYRRRAEHGSAKWGAA